MPIPWIRQAIGRAVADYGRTVRLPVHVVESLGKLERARRDFREAHGHDPGERELATRLDMPAQKVRVLLDSAKLPLSLDASAHDEDEREREVLRMRFGLASDHEYTLAEVARRFNLSRERVRQIEARALTKLSAS